VVYCTQIALLEMEEKDGEPPCKKMRVENGDGGSSGSVSCSTHSAASASDSAKNGAGSADAVRRMLESSDHSHSSRMHITFPSQQNGSSSSAVMDTDMDLDALAPFTHMPPRIDEEDHPPLPLPPSTDWSYVDKFICAPMVRISTLPFRCLALQYGADMVYSEELVARKLRYATRRERVDEAGYKLVDFLPGREPSQTSSSASTGDGDGVSTAPVKPAHNSGMRATIPVLTTYAHEPLVVQLGTSNALDALAAAQVVANDVRAIDINMGCPKHFSLQGGMGAALLSKPDTIHDILSTLKRNLNLPITCKIRLLDREQDTVELVRRIEAAGANAVAVHARRIPDRPRHRALREQIRSLSDAIRIPLIYNGDCFYGHEVATIKQETGAASVMTARGAMWNASIFRRRDVMSPVSSVVSSYLRNALRLNHHFSNIKYCVMEMLKGHIGASELFRQVTRSKDAKSLYQMLDAGMASEPSLMTHDYKAPVAFGERPDYSACNLTNGTVPVDVLVAPNMNGSSSSSFTTTTPVVSVGLGPPKKKLSWKERKYLAKQMRKNREGRKKELEEQQSAALVTEANAAPSSASTTESVAVSSALPANNSTIPSSSTGE